MWRNKMTCAVGGLFAACTAANLAPSTQSLAQSASFDARWLAMTEVQKADRIESPKVGAGSSMHFFTLPTFQTTVVVRDLRKPAPSETMDEPGNVEKALNTSSKQPAIIPARTLPHDAKRKEKLPVGCESSFSPVTTPVMANVSGRCLS